MDSFFSSPLYFILCILYVAFLIYEDHRKKKKTKGQKNSQNSYNVGDDTTLREWKAKRKKALIAVLTLGLSEAPWEMLFNNSKEADKGMSFGGTVFGFLFNCIWFILWTALTSLVMWVINIFKLLNYHCSIKKYENN